MGDGNHRRVRLLPWTGTDGKHCYLLGDGAASGVLSRHADHVEAVQLGFAGKLQGLGLLVLPGGDLASAGAARRYIRDVARSWELLPEAVDTLEAITGEFVANALEHGHSQSVTVALSLAAGTVTVSLTDEGTGHVFVLGVAGPEQESGRGLLIVDALATRWGQLQTGGRFTVWAEVDVRHDPAHKDVTRDFREEP